MERRYYAAYGSNLNIDQMTRRCPGARIVGISTINGYRLMFKGSKTGAYLTIEPAKNYSVPVAIWEVTESDEERLDVYEGHPNFYKKKNFKLTVFDFDANGNKKLDVFAYIMVEGRKFGIPSPYYMSTCTEGYDDFGFKTTILEEAHDFSVENWRRQTWGEM